MRRLSYLLALVALAGSVLQAQTAQPWQTGTYVYDGAGNVKSIGTDQYRYDGRSRVLSGTAGPDHSQSATYDAWGNIRTMTTDGTTLTFGVNAATNRLTVQVDPVTGQPYNVFGTYDAAGRLLNAAGIGNSFVYDGNDTVTRTTVDNTTKVHLYTVDDERIASVTIAGGVETRSDWTLRDQTGRVVRRLERNGAQWTWKEDYIYAGQRLHAAEVDTPARVLHFFSDHLGSPRLITGNGGAKVSLHTYFPFGAEVTAPGQDNEKLKFTGHERDSATLDYMHARYYAVTWGRFISVDPEVGSVDRRRSQNWNRYAYAENNPVANVDPDGRQSAPAVSPSSAGPMAPLSMAIHHVHQMHTNPSYRNAMVDSVRSVGRGLRTMRDFSMMTASMLITMTIRRPFIVTPNGVVMPPKDVNLVPTATGTGWLQIHTSHDHDGVSPHTHRPEVHEGPGGEIDVERTTEPTTPADIDEADQRVKDGELRPRTDRKDKGDKEKPKPKKPNQDKPGKAV